MAWLVRADAGENAGIYAILLRSTYFVGRRELPP
jgi:hypothetical protein